MPLGAATASNDLVFTTLLWGVLVGLKADTVAIVYRHELLTSTSPIAIAATQSLSQRAARHIDAQIPRWSVCRCYGRIYRDRGEAASTLEGKHAALTN